VGVRSGARGLCLAVGAASADANGQLVMTELETRILEVATWILKVNPQFEHNYFRSEEIQPFHKRPVGQEKPICAVADFKLGAEKRRALLREKNIALITPEQAATYGNLIYTSPDESVLDGAVEFSSQGLLDEWEVPAWDTWVTFGDTEFKEFDNYSRAVISWIPKTTANLFFSGLSVAIMDNIGWLKLNTHNIFIAHLTIEPKGLEFIEIDERDKAALLDRLQLISGIDYHSTPAPEAQPPVADDYDSLPAPTANNFLRRIKSWFS
jgi:hypothetical protein